MIHENFLDKLFFNQITYKQLYKLKEEKKLLDYFVIDGKKSFVLREKRKDQKLYLFFLCPISVIFQNVYYNNKYQDFEQNNIYSSIQIEEYFNNLNFSNPEVIIKNSKKFYYEAKFDIDPFIEDDKLIIYNNTSVYNDFISNYNIIDDNEKIFNPENLSKYFYKYFLYNKINNNNNIFEYYYTQNRKDLFSFLKIIICSKDIHFFKFCGPTSTGKSTTLLKFSRQFGSIIYLNLKLIYELEKSQKIFDYYNLIVYEFGRLDFENNRDLIDLQNLLKLECQNKPSIFIIYKILDFIKYQNCIIIFDQFKMKYINTDYFDKIENLIKNSNLKLIICSSINDRDIRKEVLKTIKYFRGNPKELNQFTQFYYFYFAQNFFEKVTSGDNELDKLLNLFDYKPKYKFLLLNSNNKYDTIKAIKNKIISKMINFFSFDKDLDLCKILLNIKSNINLKLTYDQFSNIIEKVPLKYYILKLEEEYFEIDYVFKFIKVIEKEKITQEECKNYFENKKYLIDKSFDGKVKGEFFEMSSKFYLEFQNAVPKKIDYKISVKNIANMEILENEDNIFGKLIYNSKFKGLEMVKKTPEKEAKEIIHVKELLNKNKIENKENLNLKYAKKTLIII